MPLAIALAAIVSVSVGAAEYPMIDFEKFTLPNGLTVLLSPDPAVPVVTLALVVPVGARQEERGRSGFAHLFEHLMFQGSANVPKGKFDKILESYGAENNAWTALDYTFYYETLPSHALKAGLWLDADRLGALQITEEALRNQVDVVKEEKRQNVYNEAYGRLMWVEIGSRTFANWQNAHDTYGGFADLEAADLADVRKFFDDHYAPRNVHLSVVGDFDPKEVRRQIERYFGWMPNRGEPPRLDFAEPAQAEERGFEIDDAHATVGGVAIVWNNMPERGSAGYYALSLLGRLMFEGKSARLYQLLVKDAQVATAIDEPYAGGLGFPISDWTSYRRPGLFGGFILRKEGVSAEGVKKLVYGEANRIAQDGVSKEELERVMTKFRSDWIRGRQTTQGRAAALLSAALLDGGPDAVNSELGRFLAVTRRDIQAAARSYLVPAVANVFDLRAAKKGEAPEPETQSAPAAKKTPTGGDVRGTPAFMARAPRVPEMKPYKAPPRRHFTLGNGIRVSFIEDRRQPLVTALLAVEGGTALTAMETPGLSHALAELLTAGTDTKDAKKIAEAADAFGGDIEAGARRDHVVVRASALSEFAGRMLGLLAEVAGRPSFPESEVALRKKNMLEELKLERSQPQFLASVAFNRAVFGGHPYAVVSPTEESIGLIDRERVRELHRRVFDPRRARLVVVGDLPADGLREMLEASFRDWVPAGADALAATPAPVGEDGVGHGVVLFDRAGSEQSTLTLGSLSPREDHPDFYKLLLANHILGGSFAARLSTDLREKRGYTYGVYSHLSAYRYAGTFHVGTQVRTEVTEKMVAGILEHLKRLRAAPVKRAELEQAKNMLVGDFARELETQAGLAEAVAHGLLRDLPDDYLDGYVERVRGVSVADIKGAARAYLAPERMTIAVVGDAAKLGTSLDVFANGPAVRVGFDGRPSVK